MNNNNNNAPHKSWKFSLNCKRHPMQSGLTWWRIVLQKT